MASDKMATQINLDQENHVGGNITEMPSGQPGIRTIKGGISDINLSRAERFKGVTKSLTNDAIKI